MTRRPRHPPTVGTDHPPLHESVVGHPGVQEGAVVEDDGTLGMVLTGRRRPLAAAGDPDQLRSDRLADRGGMMPPQAPSLTSAKRTGDCVACARARSVRDRAEVPHARRRFHGSGDEAFFRGARLSGSLALSRSPASGCYLGRRGRGATSTIGPPPRFLGLGATSTITPGRCLRLVFGATSTMTPGLFFFRAAGATSLMGPPGVRLRRT